jgi:hypothetical protein
MKLFFRKSFWNLDFLAAVLPTAGQIHIEKGGEEYAKV